MDILWKFLERGLQNRGEKKGVFEPKLFSKIK